MYYNKLLPLIVTSILIINTPLFAKEDTGFVSTIIKSAVRGMAEEAGKRFMETILSNRTNKSNYNSKKYTKKITWYKNMSHPKYDNVIASSEEGKWIPKSGYIWSDANNNNDWTVILKKYNKEEKTQSSPIQYTLIYKGKDGMNIRATPGGKNILAATFFQNSIPLIHKPSQNNINGNWKKFKITGWMVEKNNHNHHKYLSKTYNGISTVIWDGNGDSSDNFINLRTTTNFTSNIVAKVYTNTSIRIIERKEKSQYYWAKVELIGWIKVQKSTGKKYLIKKHY